MCDLDEYKRMFSPGQYDCEQVQKREFSGQTFDCEESAFVKQHTGGKSQSKCDDRQVPCDSYL